MKPDEKYELKVLLKISSKEPAEIQSTPLFTGKSQLH
jgi:hypothetical protein